MAEHLRQLDEWFSSTEWPAVACPVCSIGHVAADAIECVADPGSRAVFLQSSDPMHIKGVFYGSLKCARATCGATMAAAGDYAVEPEYSAPEYGVEPRLGYVDIVRLRFAHPAFPLIRVPEGTPISVTDAIAAASSVVWADPSSAANRLRFAVEELLTANGIPKTGLRKNGKSYDLSPHDRIDLFRAIQPDVADAVEAVKWIGNSGSHESSLRVADVIDGAEILGLALRSLYDRTEADLLRKVAEINNKYRRPSPDR